MGLYIGNEQIGGGLLVKVNTLPETNATNYAKHQIYQYENELYFIVQNGTSYKYKKLDRTPVRYSGNITASRMGTPDATSNTYFKFDSDTVSSSDYDGYVNSNGVLTGVNSFSNITKIALFNETYVGTIAYINGNYISTNGDVQVINLSGNGDITIYGLFYSD